jgi:hypothetical protein
MAADAAEGFRPYLARASCGGVSESGGMDQLPSVSVL